MREIGGSGGIDIAAFFSTTNRLLLVDCKNSKPATPQSMRSQRTQANRLVLSTLSNITPLPPLISVVLLGGWSAHREDSSAEHLPGWQSPDGVSRIPSAERWGVIPFVTKSDDQTWCVIGKWNALAACDWSPAMNRIAVPDNSYGRIKRLARGLELREDSDSFITLRMPASGYAAATGASPSPDPLRSLLEHAYAGSLNSGGLTFIGETNEKGNVRLCFSSGDSDAWDTLLARVEALLQLGPV